MARIRRKNEIKSIWELKSGSLLKRRRMVYRLMVKNIGALFSTETLQVKDWMSSEC